MQYHIYKYSHAEVYVLMKHPEDEGSLNSTRHAYKIGGKWFSVAAANKATNHMPRELWGSIVNRGKISDDEAMAILLMCA